MTTLQRVGHALAHRSSSARPLILGLSPICRYNSASSFDSTLRLPFQGRRYASSDYLPMILQPRFWRTLTPKAWRSDAHSEAQLPARKTKGWNPATFFIIIFLLIGSQAIQLIALQRDYVHFSNQTEAKLSLLREVVKKVQAGEDVDVEAMLGTGNKVKEKEWEEVLRELEEEDAIIQSRRQKQLAKKAARNAAKEKEPGT